jgi:hypothetical protein
LGFVEWVRDPAAAIGSFRYCLERADRGSSTYIGSVAAGHLCRCYAAVGDEEGAVGTIRRGVVIARESGSPMILAQILDYGGQALTTLGRYEEGATLIAVATRAPIASRHNMKGLSLDERLAAQQAARERLGPDRYDDAVQDGAAMTPETAVAYTLNVLDRLSIRSDG